MLACLSAVIKRDDPGPTDRMIRVRPGSVAVGPALGVEKGETVIGLRRDQQVPCQVSARRIMLFFQFVMLAVWRCRPWGAEVDCKELLHLHK